MEESDIRVAIDSEGDTHPFLQAPPLREDPRMAPGSPVTLLTTLILTLLAILLLLVGNMAIETERVFFRRMTLGNNQEIADLLGQQIVQVLTAATGLVEDISRYPSVRRSFLPEQDRESPTRLFQITTARNPVMRSLTARDPSGKILYRSVGVNSPSPAPFPEDLRTRLLEGEVPSRLSHQYQGVDRVLCMGFAAAVEGPGRLSGPAGTLEAELSLSFLEKLVNTVRVGRTGKVLIVNREGEIVISTLGFDQEEMGEFQRGFPVDRAFQKERGGLAYGGESHGKSFLASYREVRSAVRKGFDADLPLSPFRTTPFTTSVNPREVPNWLVIVQQDYEEGLALANRMRFNILLLVGIGMSGLLIIARLWWDSLRAH